MRIQEVTSCLTTSFACYGGKKPESSEEGAKQMAKLGAWLGGLGNGVVNTGTPMGTSKTVSSEGVADYSGSNPLTGFSFVKAESMDAALEMAKRCPFLDIGTIKVAEVKEILVPSIATWHRDGRSRFSQGSNANSYRAPSLTVERATQALSLLPERCAVRRSRRPAALSQQPTGTSSAFDMELGIYEPSNHKALRSRRP
ncbi:MAG: hypothetical protein JSV89_08475 [Spirochaetaceae bacterium]|nr:MAG: hypothetical protein JSV89_08475 [Spirochaetaceae bacterium]